MRREWIICALLAALTLGVYWPVRNFDFVYYDDPQFINENPLIKSGLSGPGIVYAFTQPVVGNWHPVTVLSHLLDCELFGADPGAHHLVNAALHTLNALLLFLLLRLLTGSTWRSALVAAIFALHPLHVESVAWISERKDLLSGLFFLLTLWAYARSTGWAQWPNPAARSSGQPGLRSNGSTSPRFHVLALLFYALGLMSKPMLVTLPFVLLLLDVWPLRRFQAPGDSALARSAAAWRPVVWRLFREKIPFFALAAVCSMITLIVQRGAGAMGFFQHLTLADRLGNAVESYVRYLGKLVWPAKLAIVYPHPARGYFLNDAWPAWQIAAAALLLVLISAWCVLRLARQPYLAVGWFWFLGTLVPVIGVVQAGEQAMANRYTYLPLIGPAIALVWGLRDLVAFRVRPAATGSAPSGFPRGAVLPCIVAAGLSLAVLAWITSLQVRHWRNTVSLFEYAVAVTPDNPSAQFALGVGLEKEGHLSAATVQYRVALAIDPAYNKADYNLGQIFSKAGDTPSAAAHFAAALRSAPDDLATRLNLANCLQRLGQSREAIAHYEESLQRDPASTEALNNLAWLLATDPDPQLRDGGRAVELARRAVALSKSGFPTMIGTLAAAYAEAANFPEAVATAEKAAAAATLQGQPEVAAKNRELLELYRAGRPYREGAGSR